MSATKSLLDQTSDIDLLKSENDRLDKINAAFLKAAIEILRRHDEAVATMPDLIDQDGERFAAGYYEGIGQAADLLLPIVVREKA